MMHPIYLLLAISATSCHTVSNNGTANYGKTNEQLITAALMENYDRITRPVLNRNDSVRVRLNPRLVNIIDVDVTSQTIFFKQWLNMYWYDPNLRWNPEFYGGVTSIMVQRSNIWLPDIVFVEQTSVSSLSDKHSLAKITSDGNVTISADQLITVTCKFDVSDFPYDTQNCSFDLTSWMYSADEIDQYPTDPVDLTAYNENDEWTLRKMTSRKQMSVADGIRYVDVWYDIVITRKPDYYITTFIWPSFLITCLSIIGVFSPFSDEGKREEKVTMGLTTLLTMAVILMIITDQMPKSSNTPLLGIFVMLEIGIASVATLMAVFIIHLSGRWMFAAPVPIWLLKLTRIANQNKEHKNSSTTQLAQSPINSRKREGVETVNQNIRLHDERDESLRDQWSKVTHRLDLIFMIIFLIANVIICITILLIGNSKLSY